MPVILPLERHSWRARLFLLVVYLLLSVGGLTMVYPFLITVTASMSNSYDYYRFAPVLRAFFDRPDRYMRQMSAYFKTFPAEIYPGVPANWGNWLGVARDEAGFRAFAQRYLAVERQPEALGQWERLAADYADFHLDYDIRNTVCWYDPRTIAGFVREQFYRELKVEDPERFAAMSRAERRQAALERLQRAWAIPYTSFFTIDMKSQLNAPLHHAGWDYRKGDAKAECYQNFKAAYREMHFRPGARRAWAAFRKEHGQTGKADWPVSSRHPEWPLFKQFVGRESPMSRTIPYTFRQLWIRHLERAETLERLGLDPKGAFTVDVYNRLSGGGYEHLQQIPFPLPVDALPAVRVEWDRFVHDSYPRRMIRIRVTPELEERFRDYVRGICRTVETYNRLSDAPIAAWSDIRLPEYDNSTLWRNFVPQVPVESLELLSAERSWQEFLAARHGSVEEVNRAYGWRLGRLEEAYLPIPEALAVTFFRHEWSYFLEDVLANYRTVGDYLFIRGRALVNTLILIVLAITATLTVNPLAAYALSRFNLKATEKILLFLLATMAFPSAVTAIPGFLLIRDLGLLNTLAALVLPGIASGMSIFILKGFFDGLPRELYEAATIDGAPEWQIFLRISLPMVTPILAVNALHSFIAAYNSWEWALLVCQKERYWTLAVWMYQMSQTSAAYPWTVMAGFVMISIPTAIVFIACQNVILRGIVLPSMK